MSTQEYVIGVKDAPVAAAAHSVHFDNLKQQLQTTPVSTLFPTNRTSIVTVEKTEPISKAFETLIKNGILSVPVYDPIHRNHSAFVDVIDILCAVLSCIKEEDLNKDNVEHLLETSEMLKSRNVDSVTDLSGRNPYYAVQDSAPLSIALEAMDSHKLHRLPVISATGELITVVSQSQFISFLYDNIVRLPSSAKTVGELQLGTQSVISINKNKRALDAFLTIQKEGLSGMAVVDDTGLLVGNISATDLKNVGSDAQFLSKILHPISQFLSQQDTRGEPAIPGPIAVRTSATLEEVITKLAMTGTHRVYIVDERGHPTGVVSLGDVLSKVQQLL